MDIVRLVCEDLNRLKSSRLRSGTAREKLLVRRDKWDWKRIGVRFVPLFFDNAATFIKDIVENFFEGGEIVVILYGCKLIDQSWILIIFRTFIAHECLKIAQSALL